MDKQLNDLLLLFNKRKADIKRLEEELQTLQDSILPLLHKYEGEYEDEQLRAVVVEGTRTSWDEEFLRNQLSDTLWIKITERVLSKERLEAEVAKKKIPPAVLEDALIIKHNKPYLKITPKG